MSNASEDTRLKASSARLRVMAEAAMEGGAYARANLRRIAFDEVTQKAARDYQTAVDVATERLIVDRLARAFPAAAIEGEEAAADRAPGAGAGAGAGAGGAGAGWRFVIDPIDGTTNFAWGMPHFGVVVTLVEAVGGETIGGEAREVTAGVVYDPCLDELFVAEKGRGAWLDGRPLRLGGAFDPVNSVIGAGLPIPGQVKSVPVETYHAALRRLMDTTAGVRRLGSSALSTAWVAAGRLDGFFEDSLSLHDYGASMLIVREAGGLVTGLTGGPVTDPGGILAARPDAHAWLLAGLQPAKAA